MDECSHREWSNVITFVRMSSDLLYQIALKNLVGVGPSRAKMLVSYCGGCKEVFEISEEALRNIPGISSKAFGQLDRDEALRVAEKECEFVERAQIQPLFFLDEAYPRRLKHCNDGPILLYTQGKMNLNVPKVVSIVGTRRATEYGLRFVEQLVRDLVPHNPLVVSGLAYGIDVAAHRAALDNGLQTVGVLGNSLDRVYPNLHLQLAEKMKANGGLISEFESGTKPDRENFPQRNRIVAGMTDVCIVVESAKRGGSMITAFQAADYNRDVMALPGKVGAEFSAGCNFLIKSQRAHMIESIKDLEYTMGWEVEAKSKPAAQKQLFVELNPQEQQLYDLLKANQKESLDNISLGAGIPVSQASTLLLELEFKGVVKSLPGKIYSLA